MNGVLRTFSDSGVVTWRNLMNVRRNPEWLLGATLFPIMFVLMFAYVFGGAIGGPGGDSAQYREFLIAGIFAQTVAFNSSYTVVGFASDLQRGIIDRFRSLPMSRFAVIVGRTTADQVLSLIVLVVMTVCGLLIGWRIRGSVFDAVLGYLVILMFAFALSWVGAYIGLVARSVEVANSAGLMWMFPLTFISSAFVPQESLPGVLNTIADWNPFTAAVNATRDLFGNNAPAGFPEPTGWPAENAALYAVLSCVVIIAIFAPLAAARYRKVASK
ncbi:ABC transporter efflux protein, DrrB family [Amycolatopsis arida]|uniref:Transport permease protein n=1 Tax=Amycolatopsis arida TaxID=587909 RepID=A0A1I5TDW8_9PSEU|nr:ABC transporter permease [Amycolatopsis arida]TDX96131.1 ABC transporter DrrB family efflux protein [Amycolatopsis arida]SFP81245.1 ABC transporter efflux protein, DrrB family [Amycolatopsis arida]